MSEHKCEGKVWCHTKYLHCGKTARYEHEGRWYCKRHHPPTVQAKLDARNKKFEEDWKSRLQAAKEANEARAEMQRKAAAYDGLIAQRDALLVALKEADDLLRIARGALWKLGLNGLGSDTRLSHEVRMFALEFSAESRDGPGVLQVNGTGRALNALKSIRAAIEAVEETK